MSHEVDGKNCIDVDGDRCVACGACFDVCEHGAREFRDDTERFFEDLKKGEKISVLLAPAFKANYPDEYGKVLGGLKALGVNHIISVSFGADITTWAYLNYVTKNKFYGGISQPCSAVVGYIERYIPELIPKLFPVQSPMMCTAIYAKKEMGITDKLASQSRDTAGRSNEDQDKIMSSVGGIIEGTGRLNDIVQGVDVRTQTLATATQEITASVSMVLDTVNSIKNKLQMLGEE